MKELKGIKIIKEFLLIIIGTFFMAISTALFLLPNQLSTGGFSGISTVIYYLFNYPVGTVMLVLNVPLFLIAFFKINKMLFFKSIVGATLLSVFIDYLEGMYIVTNDRFLACIYGGIIMGIGTALILKAAASTGGTDLLSYIIRAYNSKISSSKVIIIADTIIIILNVVFFGKVEIGLYSVIAIYLMGKMIDIFFEGIYFTKVLFVISDKYEEIARVVGEKVKRGSTGIFSKGMYSNNEKVMLFCVASRKEIAEIKQIIKKIDKKAFFVVTNAVEAMGEGFSE